MLQRISSKDLRDVSLDVLIDHMQSHVYKENMDYFRRFIRNPRVANEMLTPYKSFFEKAISEADKAAFKADWNKLAVWVSENINVDATCNLGGAPISPAGVWKARVADAHSRNIFFVSMARSLGIPSRIDEVTGKVQLISNDGVTDVNFGATDQVKAKKGKLVAKYTPIKSLSDPKYYSHFSISKLTDEGTLQLLNYDEGDVDMGEGATWSNLLKVGTALDEGNYLMVTGTRLASGGVLAEMEFFQMEAGKTTTNSRFENELKRAVYKKWLATDSFTYFSFIEKMANKGLKVCVDELTYIEQQMALMFYYDLFQYAGCYQSLQAMFDDLSTDEYFVSELKEVIGLLKNRCEAYEKSDNSALMNFPLKLHGVYTKDQILVAVGTSTLEKKSPCREGCERNKNLNVEAMFVDVIKDREEGSNTNYNDFAINETLFNWETQNSVSPQTKTGQNYINETQTMLLFVRQQDSFPEDKGRTMGFTYLGEVELVKWQGAKPIEIVWRLKTPMPASMLKIAKHKSVG
jgi:hypothetical protein